MKSIAKIVRKSSFPTMQSPEQDAGSSVPFQIGKQFLVSSHQDSLQITWLKKSHLNRHK